jgi:hypothetical protein
MRAMTIACYAVIVYAAIFAWLLPTLTRLELGGQ